MPRIEATTRVPIGIDEAFAVSQSQLDVRYAWDPFVREQRLLDGAVRPGKGVRTATTSRHRLRMVSEYTSFRAPTHVGMKMVEGPWFLATFGGGWSFRELDRSEHEASDTGSTESRVTAAVWRYTFTIRPRWLAPIADRIGRRILQRDIERRIGHFAAACADPDLVARAVAQLGG